MRCIVSVRCVFALATSGASIYVRLVRYIIAMTVYVLAMLVAISSCYTPNSEKYRQNQSRITSNPLTHTDPVSP